MLIDGHPQYMGLMGTPDFRCLPVFAGGTCRSAAGSGVCVICRSNAMGAINIVTRKMQQDGIRTRANVGYGSYNTLQSEVSNRIRKGRFTSIVSGSYNRTDGHRKDMEFEQYGGYAKFGYEISDAWNVWADVNLTHFDASNPGEI